jgi:hypothetical protein
VRRDSANQTPNAKNDLPQARSAQQTITNNTDKRGETTKGPPRERNPKTKVSQSTKVSNGERGKVENAFGRNPPILAPPEFKERVKNAEVFRLRFVQESEDFWKLAEGSGGAGKGFVGRRPRLGLECLIEGGAVNFVP